MLIKLDDITVEPSVLLNKVFDIPSIRIIRPQFVIEEERAKNIKRGEYIEMHRNQRANHVRKLAIAREKRLLKKQAEMGIEL